MMRRLGLLILPILCASCSDNGGMEDAAYSRMEVDVLFSPSGLGDSGYNDIILYGVRQAVKKADITLTIHQPASIDKGLEMYEEWLSTAPDPADGQKRIFIFAGNEYEGPLRATPVRKTEGNTIVLFETDTPLENVGCFHLDTYGGAYYIGRLVSDITPSAALLGANPADASIARIIDGFTDGFTEDNPSKETEVRYISGEIGTGYNDVDKAYAMSYDLFSRHRFVYPVAGGSNMGVLRYTREFPDNIYTAGVDADMAKYSSRVVASLVKRLDLLVEDLILDWLEGKEPAAMGRYGLESGYVDVAIPRDYSEYFAPLTAGLRDEAIKKEKEHARND